MATNEEIARRAETGKVAVRQDLGEEIQVGSETAVAAAAAAAAKAEIEAKILQAKKWPRDIDVFRENILKDCRRPGFAESAWYRKPVGRKKNPTTGEWEQAYAENFSVRFIEAALVHFQNVHIVARIIREDVHSTQLAVGVGDVQNNVSYLIESTIEKLVERKEMKAGRTVIGTRENSYGDTVFLLPATKDEARNLIGAERSKLIRDQGQRLLPSDILAEARALILQTNQSETAKDPDLAKKKVLDKFAGLGISAAMLKEYLGKPLEQLTVKDLEDLTPVYQGLKDGEFTWAQLIKVNEEPAEGAPPEQPKKKSSAHEKVMAKQGLLVEEQEKPQK